MIARTAAKINHRPPEINALALKLQAGAYTRCSSCLNWLDRNKVAALALYIPNDGGTRIAYTLCKRCVKHVNGDPTTQRALTDRCEAYLAGEGRP